MAALILLGICAEKIAAAEVATDKQAVILLRALAYDNNLRSRAGDTMVIAVLYKPGASPSDGVDAAFAGWNALLGVKVQDLPLKIVKLPFTNKDALRNAITAQGIDALYCCPGLDADLAALREVSQQQHVITLGSREEYVRGGLSLGVFSIEGKATIMVNLAASKSEGASLSSELLRLANVLR